MVGLLLESALRSLALGGAIWLGLTLLRVRNPHTHMTAWIVVLVASLSMPILMHRLTLTIPAAAPALRVIESMPALSSALEATHVPALQAQGPLTLPPAAEPAVVHPPRQVMPAPVDRRSLGWPGFDRRSLGWPGFDWRALATAIYLLVAGALLLRLFTGLLLSWRMARAARPIHESWTGDADVRVSDLVGGPVTFGSTVLLPVEYIDWSEAKRQAVLSHEGSHVAHGDFYVLLLAAFNRAVFWFSPFAWWQLVRLTELAEIISDDAALEMLDDRSSYAGILLDIAGRPERAPVAIAMARACTVRKRVERILAGTAAPARMGWRKRALVAAALAPAVIISEGAIVLSASKPPAGPVAAAPRASAAQTDALAAAPSIPAAEHLSAAANAPFLDRYVGHYEADPKVLPGLVLTVTREGDHLFVRRTGEVKLEVFPESDRAFFYGVIDQRISFRGDGPAQVMVLHQNGMDIEATRVDAAAAKRAAELFDERVADQATPRTAIDVDPSLFDRYVGYYELAPRSIITIMREGDKLFAQATGGLKRRLFAASERELFYEFVAAQFTFIADGEGRATALVLHQNGREFPSRRVDEARAKETEARAREVTDRRADQERPRTAVAIDPRLYDRYAGLYQRGPNSIFTVTREGDRLFAQLTGQQKLELFPESDREFFYKAVAAQITFVADGERPPTGLILHQNGTDLRAAWLAGLPGSHGRDDQPDAKMLDRHVGWYELGPLRALAVKREGDRLLVQETGRPKFEVVAHSDREFVSTDAGAFVIFMSDALGRTTELLLHEPSPGGRRAVRIDAVRAQAIENAFARRVAAAPDRFRDQVPADGSKAAVLRAIEELQRGAPRYERMSEQLADNVRRQISQLHALITAVGAVESVFFRGVGPGGYDIYGAKFANGFAEFRMLVDPDGSIEDMTFRPGGDDTPGGMVTCSQEQTLKSLPRTAPIQLLLYNGSGADIRVFELDFEGKRSRSVMIGDDRSAPILTYISNPWVVTDTSGQCVEIIMPGQNTRYLTITADAREQVVRSAPRRTRTSPMPGSEQALRQYIDAIGRGEPNYDDMTPQVAAETRQQLLLNQAILARLGALRAMSFRGVTQIGNDLYIAHFANGSAEWRIGLVKEGKIGRMALGPQY
jgi:hypothetical protein